MVVSRQFWESISDVGHGEVAADEDRVVSDVLRLQDQVSGALQLWEATRESQAVDVAENWSEFSENVDCHAFIFTLLNDKLKYYFLCSLSLRRRIILELRLQRLCEVRMRSSPTIAHLLPDIDLRGGARLHSAYDRSQSIP